MSSSSLLHIIFHLISQVSKEGDTFDVPIEIAKLSNLVMTTIGEDDGSTGSGDDDGDGGGKAGPGDNAIEIPLPNVRTQVLAKVIEYCTHFNQEPSEFMLECCLCVIMPLKNVYQ